MEGCGAGQGAWSGRREDQGTREDFRYAMEVVFLFLGLFLIIFL